MLRGPLLSSLLALACVLTLVLPARAAQPSVVLVPTEGAKSWIAAERRLSAELSAAGLRVLRIPPTDRADLELPRHATAFGAVGAVQVLRDGEFGVIRVWLERDESRGAGYRHIRINLRGPEVVSHAVLPVVELLFIRSIDVPKVTTSKTAHPTPASRSKAPGKRQLGAPVWGPPIRYHVRSDMKYAGRLGLGPWFSGAGTTPAINVGLGVRAHWFELWSFEPEAVVHFVAHGVEVGGGVGSLPLVGFRAHWLFEPWPKSSVSLGIGPGVGVVLMRLEHPSYQADSQWAHLLSGRVELASALAPYVDVLFLATLSYDWARTVSYSERTTDARMFQPSLDAQLALDWHWQ